MRKPAGYWTKGEGHELVKQVVLGAATEDEAVAILAPTMDLGAFGSQEQAARADVRWYAARVRDELGLPGLREQRQASRARQEIAAQG